MTIRKHNDESGWKRGLGPYSGDGSSGERDKVQPMEKCDTRTKDISAIVDKAADSNRLPKTKGE